MSVKLYMGNLSYVVTEARPRVLRKGFNSQQPRARGQGRF